MKENISQPPKQVLSIKIDANLYQQLISEEVELVVLSKD